MKKKIILPKVLPVILAVSCLPISPVLAASGEPAAEKNSADTSELSAEDGLFGAFETVTLDGDAEDQDIFTEADLNMVNIWGTFCGPCIREMPALGEIAEEYEEKGLQLIGIITDVTEAENETALEIVDYTGADYTHLVLSETLMQGYLSEVQAVPTTVFLDREGKQVGEVYVGSRSKEDWCEIIDGLLEQEEETEK